VGKHIGSDHLPITIEICGGKPASNARRKSTFSYKKADWTLFQQSLDDALQKWDENPPYSATKANSVLSSAILQAAKKSIPQGSHKIQSAWWCQEVEDAVVHHRLAQEALKAYPDDDTKAQAYHEAAAKAQSTIDETKTKLWREFISDSAGNLSSAEVWSVIRVVDGRALASAPSSILTSDKCKKLNSLKLGVRTTW